MQDKWKDLIPFYVAGTLSEKQKQALEAYLSQCGDPCQQEVEEWRTLASATWQYGNDVAMNPPPLSTAVRAEVARDADLRASGKIIAHNGFNNQTARSQAGAPVAPPRQVETRASRRPSRLPLTMVAAFVTVVIFGGILLRQLTPDDLQPAIIQLTGIPDEGADVTSEFGGQVGILPDNPNNNSGLIPTPTRLAPQATSTPLPTFTPTPNILPTVGSPVGTQSSISAVEMMPIQGCTISNDTPGALTVYDNASFSANPVGVMQEGSQHTIRVMFDGWFELSYGRWVYGANVTTFGDCSNLITATPTMIGDSRGNATETNNGIPNCAIVNTSNTALSLHQWPDINSAVNGQLAVGQRASVVIGAGGWYQVFYAQWVNGGQVTLEGNGCNNLWTPTPTYVVSPTPPPTVTPPNGVIGTSAIVRTFSTVMRGSPNVNAIFLAEYQQGETFTALAHNGETGAARWYLVRDMSGRVGWIPSADVDIYPDASTVEIAATIPVMPTASPVGFVPTPAPQTWMHVTTVTQHDCGGTVGEQNTIAVDLQNYGSELVMRYPATGTIFTLESTAPNTFSGMYGEGATVQVDLFFTSSTSYNATETVTQESGCIVRSSWTGRKTQ